MIHLSMLIYYNIDNFRDYIFNENPKIIGSEISKYQLNINY